MTVSSSMHQPIIVAVQRECTASKHMWEWRWIEVVDVCTSDTRINHHTTYGEFYIEGYDLQQGRLRQTPSYAFNRPARSCSIQQNAGTERKKEKNAYTAQKHTYILNELITMHKCARE